MIDALSHCWYFLQAKEFYFTKTVEVDKLKRENASQKDIEKAEARVNKACMTTIVPSIFNNNK